jgi:predicted HicB family RNase H-like nuclease
MSLLKAGRPTSKKERAIASVQETEEENVRMNINISKAFYKKIKLMALDKDITITDLVIKALNEYMSK